MEITDVRVRLSDAGNERLCGYCTITIDGEFVVRDLRIIAGEKGLFVAMPSRKTAYRCPFCGHKNFHHARFCNDCGKPLKVPQVKPGEQGRLHVDIAHPITAECRQRIQESVLSAFEREREKVESGGRAGRPYREEDRDEEVDFDYA